jgi:hypothetical protein
MTETGLEFRSLAILVGAASSREYCSTYAPLAFIAAGSRSHKDI